MLQVGGRFFSALSVVVATESLPTRRLLSAKAPTAPKPLRLDGVAAVGRVLRTTYDSHVRDKRRWPQLRSPRIDSSKDNTRFMSIPRSGFLVARTGDDLVLALPFAEPFDWAQLLHFFAARAIAGVELVDDESYTRTVATADGFAVVRIARGRRGTLELRVTGATPHALPPIAASARRAFDV